ncbi:MFS general substrate transporter [Aureobasidium pullulans]|uniref:MFS general substrate transporter n=1 Tax=Aureobasidium pullulans TaxID=5580 RepID=A0A4S8XQD4_AURPU|nr:MFS general substrate transporter [Aureobasidium pullulans]
MAATEKMEKMVDTDQVEDIDQIKAERGSMLLDDDDAQRAMARKVLWKLDTRILPVLALLFLCSFLDRTNVGNAKILGLEKSIGVNDHQYASGLAIFFAFYIASELPSNLVLKKISPRIWLPCLTFAWGIVGMCLGFVQNYAGFLVVRAFLGITEGGLLPGMVLYLSSMYTRGELALRIGLFYTTASLSGAFGGLLARGLSSIGATAGIDAGWRWIMIVEGLLTAVVGASAYFLLPNDVSTARFLTEEEREFALYRLSRDHSYGLPSQRITEPERFSWSEVRRGVLDPSLWFSASAYFAILCGLYSFGLFLPTIITGLGYTANEAQLWSVIPYAVASCLTIVAAFLSDRLRLRGPIMLCTLPLAIIGYAVIANVTNPHVKFGMTFMMATGLYASVPPVLVWISNNSAGHYKRATATGLQLAIANCGGFVSAFTYSKVEKPQYHKSHTIVLGLLVFAWFMVLANILWCHKVNKDKAAGKYDKYIGCGDDREPEFKLML